MSTSISKHLQNEYNFDAWVITCEIDDDDMPQNEKDLCEKSAIEYVKFRGFDVKRYSEGFSFQVVDRNSTKIEDAISHHISNDTGLSPELFLHAWKTKKILSKISEPSETSSNASVDMSVASTSSEIYFPQKTIPPEFKIVTFGKHSGQLYKNVFENDKSYVQWVLGLEKCNGKISDLKEYFIACQLEIVKAQSKPKARIGRPPKPIVCPDCNMVFKDKYAKRYHRQRGKCSAKLLSSA